MTDTVTLKITGLDELQRKLEAIPHDVARKVIGGALKDAAAIVRDAMVEESPKNSGLMSESFGTKLTTAKTDVEGHILIGPMGKMRYPEK